MDTPAVYSFTLTSFLFYEPFEGDEQWSRPLGSCRHTAPCTETTIEKLLDILCRKLWCQQLIASGMLRLIKLCESALNEARRVSSALRQPDCTSERRNSPSVEHKFWKQYEPVWVIMRSETQNLWENVISSKQQGTQAGPPQSPASCVVGVMTKVIITANCATS